DSPLATFFACPLEVLDDVRDVQLAPVHVRPGQGLVEEPAGRADEGPATQVFLVSRLLADEDDARRSLALTKDGLGRPLVEVAGGARARLLAEDVQSQAARAPVGDLASVRLSVTHAPLIGKSHASRSRSRSYLPSS